MLAAVGLGCDLLALARQEETIKPRWEGFFHRAGGPPTRRLFWRESPLKPSAPPLPGGSLSPSYTLLSSMSDCNSTHSLLRSDSKELLVQRPDSSTSQLPPLQAAHGPINSLVNTRIESFKRNPRQSLTPTHVPCVPTSCRSLRRTPSDGAIKKNCPPNGLDPLPEQGALHNTGEVPRLFIICRNRLDIKSDQ